MSFNPFSLKSGKVKLLLVLVVPVLIVAGFFASSQQTEAQAPNPGNPELRVDTGHSGEAIFLPGETHRIWWSGRNIFGNYNARVSLVWVDPGGVQSLLIGDTDVGNGFIDVVMPSVYCNAGEFKRSNKIRIGVYSSDSPSNTSPIITDISDGSVALICGSKDPNSEMVHDSIVNPSNLTAAGNISISYGSYVYRLFSGGGPYSGLPYTYESGPYSPSIDGTLPSHNFEIIPANMYVSGPTLLHGIYSPSVFVRANSHQAGYNAIIYYGFDRFHSYLYEVPALGISVSGNGRVEFTSNTNKVESCNSVCDYDFSEIGLNPISLRAIPNQGESLIGWSGDVGGNCPSSSLQCSVSLEPPFVKKNVTAQFTRTITFNSVIQGTGKVQIYEEKNPWTTISLGECSNSYPSVSNACSYSVLDSSSVVLTPTEGNFQNWNPSSLCSSVLGSPNSCKINLGPASQGGNQVSMTGVFNNQTNFSLSVSGKGKVITSAPNTTITEEISQGPGTANIYFGHDPFQVASSSGEQKIIFKANGQTLTNPPYIFPSLGYQPSSLLKLDGQNQTSNPKILNNSALYEANILPSGGDQWLLSSGSWLHLQGLRGNLPNSSQQISVPTNSTAIVDFVYSISGSSQKVCESRSDSAPTNCNYVLGQPGNISLTAQSAVGQTFAGWMGDCQSAGDNPTCSLNLSSGKNIQAKFTPSTKIRLEVTGPGKLVLADINPFDGYSQLSGEECQSTIGQTKICEFITYDDHELRITPSAPPIGGYSIGYGPWTLNGQNYSHPQTCIYNGLQTVSSCDFVAETPKTTVGKTFIAPPEIAGPTLTTQVIGQGTVTLAPAPVIGSASCAPNTICTSDYIGGTKVVLTATPSTGETFIGWESTCNSANGASADVATKTCTIDSLTTDKTIKARFSGEGENILSLLVKGPGKITVSKAPGQSSYNVPAFQCENPDNSSPTTEKECVQVYPTGVRLMAVAIKPANTDFVGFQGDCEGGSGNLASCNITMDADKSVCGAFAPTGQSSDACDGTVPPPDGKIDLRVRIEGLGIVRVALQSSPNSNFWTCENKDATSAETCTLRRDEGTQLRLTASSANGTFLGWDDECSGTGVCNITLSEPSPNRVTAEFDAPAEPTCQVSVSPSSGVNPNQTVTFTASINNPGNHDYSWFWRDTSPVQGNRMTGPEETDDDFVLTGSFPSNGTYVRTFQAIEYRQGHSTGDQTWCSATVVVGPPNPPANNLSIACTVSPTSGIEVDQDVVWSAQASGGSGGYTYAWSGSSPLTGSGASKTVRYSTAGTKTGNVTVTDSEDNTAKCTTFNGVELNGEDANIEVSEATGSTATLLLSVSGDGEAYIESQPGAVYREQETSINFDADEVVTIIATADPGNNIAWGGQCQSVTDNECTLTLEEGNNIASVSFSPPNFDIIIGGGTDPLDRTRMTISNPKPIGDNTEFTSTPIEVSVQLSGGVSAENLQSFNLLLTGWGGLENVVCGNGTCFEAEYGGNPKARFDGQNFDQNATFDGRSAVISGEPIQFRLWFPNRAVDEENNANAVSPYSRDATYSIGLRAEAVLLTEDGSPVTKQVDKTIPLKFIDQSVSPE